MATFIIPGKRTWSMNRDENGHREYKIKFLVQGDIGDGPAAALTTPGLPIPGSYWFVDNDFDPWATCRLVASVTPMVTNEPNEIWEIEFTFSSKPDPARCKTEQFDDPLSVPQKVSGTFVKYTEEATVDRFGNPLVNSAWEQLRGAQVEFDKNRPTIKVEQNVPMLQANLWGPMVDTLNAFPIWGFPQRTVKLSNASWERKYYGSCFYYYTRNFEFDIRPEGWDRDLLDEGTKVLSGHWDPGTGAWITDTIGGLPTPSSPTLSKSATGGSLAANTYYYAITAFNLAGETLPSPTANITTTGTTSAINISWPAVAGATSYKIYKAIAALPLTLVALVSPSILSILDKDGTLFIAGTPPINDTTGGRLPNFRNPSDFIRFKDKNGENTKVILNGAGLPASTVDASQSGYYISIQDSNLGNSLTNAAFWILSPNALSPLDANGFDESITYEAGTVIAFPPITGNTGSPPTMIWIAVETNSGVVPSVGSTTPWLELPNYSLTLLGYSIITSYSIGDIVAGGPNAGMTHIEKYNQSNFLLLGIPTSF